MKKLICITIFTALLSGCAEFKYLFSMSEPTYYPSSYSPTAADNGDIRGMDNDGDGRDESVYVKSYYKNDGTIVRSHYRSKPSK